MTFTWNGDPSASDLEWVRFRIQDITEASAKFQDEAIQPIIDQKGNKYQAAAALCLVLAARYASEVDYTNLDLTEAASQRAKAWRQMARDILEEKKNEAVASAPGPKFVGIYETERLNAEDDTTRTKSTFAIGMNDNPDLRTSQQTRRTGFRCR